MKNKKLYLNGTFTILELIKIIAIESEQLEIKNNQLNKKIIQIKKQKTEINF